MTGGPPGLPEGAGARGLHMVPLPGRLVRTARLTLVPPGKENLPDLIHLKADERVFELMLHGTRSPERTRDELEDDIEFWQVRGYGTWCVYLTETGEFLGIAGLMERPDGRGVAMRFALWPECRGHGYAREAAKAGLDFGHRAGLDRIIAVAWEANHASRHVLGDIGMRECDAFTYRARRMLVFESLAAKDGRGPASKDLSPQG